MAEHSCLVLSLSSGGIMLNICWTVWLELANPKVDLSMTKLEADGNILIWRRWARELMSPHHPPECVETSPFSNDCPLSKAMTSHTLCLPLRLIHQPLQIFTSLLSFIKVLPVSFSTEIGAALSPSSCEAATPKAGTIDAVSQLRGKTRALPRRARDVQRAPKQPISTDYGMMCDS